MTRNLLALAGALAGGALGYALFLWITQQGYYALAIPGALLGAGAGLARARSVAVAVVCGLAATALGFYCEFRFRPFAQDESLGFFLTHLSSLSGLTCVMIAFGAFLGFWIPFRQRGPDAPR